MSKHITQSEFVHYFRILTSKSSAEDDIAFMDELDAHIAECPDCFEKTQAARLFIRGFLSEEGVADTFIRKWYPETPAQPVFDIRRAFLGVKVTLTKKMQALADTLSDKMNAVFVPDSGMLAVARGTSGSFDGAAINDLLHGSMEFELENGRKITLRCRDINHTGAITLFVYSNFEVDFVLSSGEVEIPLFKKEYDDLIEEYVYSYKLSDGKFDLMVR